MKPGWEIKKLNQISDNLDKQRVPITKKNRTKGLIPYYGASGIVDYVADFLFNEDLLCISEDGANLLARTYPIAFSISGKNWVNNHAHVLRFKNIESQKFVELYLNSIKLDDFVSGMAQPKLNQKMLNKIPIPIPPLPEQKRIVAILDKAFAAIAKAKINAEQNLKNAKELFESYLQGVFENKGEGWEEFTLREICTKITDGVHKKPNYLDEGIPFIKIKNLTCDSGISFDNVSYISIEDHEEFCKRTKPEKGDLLITKDGTIGIVRIIETDIEFSIFVSVALIKPKNKNISPYLKYVFESPYIQEQIKPKGAALKHLYLKDLREYLIPIPPEVEQRSIVKRLDALSAETKKLEVIYRQKIDDLEELKKSVLQKAFNGEL